MFKPYMHQDKITVSIETLRGYVQECFNCNEPAQLVYMGGEMSLDVEGAWYALLVEIDWPESCYIDFPCNVDKGDGNGVQWGTTKALNVPALFCEVSPVELVKLVDAHEAETTEIWVDLNVNKYFMNVNGIATEIGDLVAQ